MQALEAQRVVQEYEQREHDAQQLADVVRAIEHLARSFQSDELSAVFDNLSKQKGKLESLRHHDWYPRIAAQLEALEADIKAYAAAKPE